MNNKFLFLVSLLLICITKICSAQITLRSENQISYAKNEIGLELGGNALLYSPYYQRALFRKKNMQFNIRIGGSYFPNFDGAYYEGSSPLNTIAYIVPNILFFEKRHAWELGLGINGFFHMDKNSYYNYVTSSYALEKDNFQTFFLTPQAGYRIYFPNGRFYFRAAVSVYVLVASHQSRDEDIDVRPKVLPWGGFGFGYTFGKSR